MGIEKKADFVQPGAGNVQAAGNQPEEPVEAKENLEAQDIVQDVAEPQGTVENVEEEFFRGKKL